MKNKMRTFLALSVGVLLLGCIHMYKDEDKPQPSSEASSAVRSTPEESSTNLESSGVSPDEAGTDADVQMKF